MPFRLHTAGNLYNRSRANERATEGGKTSAAIHIQRVASHPRSLLRWRAQQWRPRPLAFSAFTAGPRTSSSVAVAWTPGMKPSIWNKGGQNVEVDARTNGVPPLVGTPAYHTHAMSGGGAEMPRKLILNFWPTAGIFFRHTVYISPG